MRYIERAEEHFRKYTIIILNFMLTEILFFFVIIANGIDIAKSRYPIDLSILKFLARLRLWMRNRWSYKRKPTQHVLHLSLAVVSDKSVASLVGQLVDQTNLIRSCLISKKKGKIISKSTCRRQFRC